MLLHELYHLWEYLCRDDWQLVGYHQEPEVLVLPRFPRLYSAHRDSDAVVFSAPSPVDERRMEAVNLEVVAVHFKASSDGMVAVVECVGKVPKFSLA